jgi:hypothetical protein
MRTHSGRFCAVSCDYGRTVQTVPVMPIDRSFFSRTMMIQKAL